MRFGVSIFPTDYAINVVEFGRACEQHGFESLFVPEHTHIPVASRSQGPVPGDLPREYWHTLDPFVALAAVAGSTSTIRLGTGICLVPQRDPIILAKEVASIDHLAGGRFLFGVGAGWNLEELRNHGTDPDRRWELMRERIDAMKVIWAAGEAEYHASMVDFGPLLSWPKPVQRPHPPILVGGAGPGALRRAVAYGDGWMPTLVPGLPLERRLGDLARLAGEAGRPALPVTVTGRMLGGEEVPAPGLIESFQRLGVERCVLWMPPLPGREALDRLTAYAGLARHFD